MITHPSPVLICVCQYSLTQQKAQRFLLRLPHFSAPIYLPRAKHIIPHTHFASGESIVGTQCVHCVYFQWTRHLGRAVLSLRVLQSSEALCRVPIGTEPPGSVLSICSGLSIYLLLWIYKPLVYLSI